MNEHDDAVIDVLARILHRAAAAGGCRAEDLLAGLSDTDLSALYVGCAKKVCDACGHCRTAGPPSASTETPMSRGRAPRGLCGVGQPSEGTMREILIVGDGYAGFCSAWGLEHTVSGGTPWTHVRRPPAA